MAVAGGLTLAVSPGVAATLAQVPRATRLLGADAVPAVLVAGGPPVWLKVSSRDGSTLVQAWRRDSGMNRGQAMSLGLTGRLDHALLLPLAGRQVAIVVTQQDDGDRVAYVVAATPGLRVMAALPQQVRRGAASLFLRLAATPDFGCLRLTFNALHGHEGQEWARLLDGRDLAPLPPARAEHPTVLEARLDAEMARTHAALEETPPPAMSPDWLRVAGVVPGLE